MKHAVGNSYQWQRGLPWVWLQGSLPGLMAVLKGFCAIFRGEGVVGTAHRCGFWQLLGERP